jgi:hypothetical protein
VSGLIEAEDHGTPFTHALPLLGGEAENDAIKSQCGALATAKSQAAPGFDYFRFLNQ